MVTSFLAPCAWKWSYPDSKSVTVVVINPILRRVRFNHSYSWSEIASLQSLLPKPEELRIQIQTGRMQCTSAMQQCRHRISCLPTLLFHVRSLLTWPAIHPAIYTHYGSWGTPRLWKDNWTFRYCDIKSDHFNNLVGVTLTAANCTLWSYLRICPLRRCHPLSSVAEWVNGRRLVRGREGGTLLWTEGEKYASSAKMVHGVLGVLVIYLFKYLKIRCIDHTKLTSLK